MHSNYKMASAPVNMSEFDKQKTEIKELLDARLVEGDAWYNVRYVLLCCILVAHDVHVFCFSVYNRRLLVICEMRNCEWVLCVSRMRKLRNGHANFGTMRNEKCEMASCRCDILMVIANIHAVHAHCSSMIHDQ